MARATRSILETRTGRLKLAPERRHSAPIGRGLALIYRRGQKAGFWSARILKPDGGHALHRLGEADDYRDADGEHVLSYYQAQDAARAAWQTVHRPTREPLTVAKAAEHYLAWFRQHRKSADRTEGTINAHILPTMGERIVAELTTRELRAWRDRIAAQPARKRTKRGEQTAYRAVPETDDQKRARKATANRCLAVLKAILNKAWQDDRVEDDAAWRRVKPFEKVESPRVRFLTVEECRRLVNASPGGLRELVRAALLTGARYGELARLNAGDFDPERRTVHIAESKSGRPRFVPLSAEGVEFFKAQAPGRHASEPLLRNPHGERWGKGQYQRLLTEAYRAAAIAPPARLHDLRHTYASLLAQAGADLLTISKLLGHADTRITARHYAHLCDRTLARAVETHLPGFGEPAMPENVVPLREEQPA